MDLTPIQKIALETLKTSPLSKTFYWTGGTLLSHYYLHHRLSFDLDFFTAQKFSYETLEPFFQALKKALRLDSLPVNKIYDRWEVVLDRPVNLRLEFVYYNHEKKRLSPLLNYRGIMIDPLPDIAANKVMAYFDRNEPKDLFDLYTILSKRKFSVKNLLQLVEKKFGVTFSEFTFWSESAKSLKILPKLSPYLLPKDKNRKEELFASISSFFLNCGKDYLESRLEENHLDEMEAKKLAKEKRGKGTPLSKIIAKYKSN